MELLYSNRRERGIVFYWKSVFHIRGIRSYRKIKMIKGLLDMIAQSRRKRGRN